MKLRIAPEASVDPLRENALVLAPHPDDETIGLGATLMRRQSASARTVVYWMNSGVPRNDKHDGRSHRERANARQRQAVAVSRELGFKPMGMNGATRELIRVWRDRLPEIEASMSESVARLLFYPALQYGHPDHDLCWAIGQLMLKRNPRLVGLEYGLYGWKDGRVDFRAPTIVPSSRSVTIGLSMDEREAKSRLLQVYATEYPRILRKCPREFEWFQAGSTPSEIPIRFEPGWVSWLDWPHPQIVHRKIKDILSDRSGRRADWKTKSSPEDHYE